MKRNLRAVLFKHPNECKAIAGACDDCESKKRAWIDIWRRIGRSNCQESMPHQRWAYVFYFKIIPLHGNFGNCGPVALSKPIRVYGDTRDQGDASCSTLLNRVWILQESILITIENYSDLDTSLESEYDSGEDSTAVSDCDEDEPSQDQDLEPEPRWKLRRIYEYTIESRRPNTGSIGQCQISSIACWNQSPGWNTYKPYIPKALPVLAFSAI